MKSMQVDFTSNIPINCVQNYDAKKFIIALLSQHLSSFILVLMSETDHIETYEYICMVNKYLFQQMEECTLMIHMLESHNLDASEWKSKRTRLKTASNTNLDKLEIQLITMDL